MAYAERKMLPSKRSSGGCDCDGVASYTATVLNAAKTLGKGLREFGGQMAAGFSGNSGSGGGGGGSGGGNSFSGSGSSTGTPEDYQPGIVTIIDTKVRIKLFFSAISLSYSFFFLFSSILLKKQVQQLECQFQHMVPIPLYHTLLHILTQLPL